jgi:hypothetical protein
MTEQRKARRREGEALERKNPPFAQYAKDGPPSRSAGIGGVRKKHPSLDALGARGKAPTWGSRRESRFLARGGLGMTVGQAKVLVRNAK